MPAAAIRTKKSRSHTPSPSQGNVHRRLGVHSADGPRAPWMGQIERLQNGFGLTQIQLAAQLLNCAPRSLTLWKKGHRPNPAALIRLQELHRLYLALAKLMPAKEIGPWMKRTNDYLDPLTPLEVINRGHIDRLWQIVHNVGSGMPT